MLVLKCKKRDVATEKESGTGEEETEIDTIMADAVSSTAEADQADAEKDSDKGSDDALGRSGEQARTSALARGRTRRGEPVDFDDGDEEETGGDRPPARSSRRRVGDKEEKEMDSKML